MPEAKKSPLQKKGGALFPKINLEEAVEYARKLVSKTHTGPQPYNTIFPGVFGVNPNNTAGQVRASALKQYGLLGGKADAYTATDLAKRIANAPTEELPPLLARAFLGPKIFKILFDTFHGDSVSLAKIKQQAASNDVHPDATEMCSRLFAESAKFSRLGEFQGDTLSLSQSSGTVLEDEEVPESEKAEGSDKALVDTSQAATREESKETESKEDRSTPSARSVIQVNVTIDSSLDTDKLERQLALLRKYGAL